MDSPNLNHVFNIRQHDYRSRKTHKTCFGRVGFFLFVVDFCAEFTERATVGVVTVILLLKTIVDVFVVIITHTHIHAFYYACTINTAIGNLSSLFFLSTNYFVKHVCTICKFFILLLTCGGIRDVDWFCCLDIFPKLKSEETDEIWKTFLNRNNIPFSLNFSGELWDGFRFGTWCWYCFTFLRICFWNICDTFLSS